jgi:starch synthase
VPIEQVQDGSGVPIDPDKFVADLAAALNEAVSDTARADRFGLAGRQRAIEHFSWDTIGDRTMQVYLDVLRRRQLAQG